MNKEFIEKLDNLKKGMIKSKDTLSDLLNLLTELESKLKELNALR